MTLVKFNQPKNSIYSYSPIDELLDNFFTKGISDQKIFHHAPAVNISETENHFELNLAAPGLSKESFKLNLEKNVLTVSSEIKSENKESNKRISRQEFNYASFSRSFTLPQTADMNNIEASYENGILSINIAKKEEAKLLSREITIK